MSQFAISLNQDNDELEQSFIDKGVISSVDDPEYSTYMEAFLRMKETTLATTVFYPNGAIAIKLNTFSTTNPNCMSALIHELSHAVMFTFERIGMPHNSDTDEAYSYLLGFLVKKFFEKVG